MQKHDSSGEDRYGSEDELEAVVPEPHPPGPTSPVTTLKSPIVVLPDHKGEFMFGKVVEIMDTKYVHCLQ